MRSKPFMLDRDYATFVPCVTPLKYRTLNAASFAMCLLGLVGVVCFGVVTIFCAFYVTLYFFALAGRLSFTAETSDATLLILGACGAGVLAFLMTLGFAAIIRSYWRGRRRYRLLNTRGTLIAGLIYKVERKLRVSFVGLRDLDISYVFMTPAGNRLMRSQPAARWKLRGDSFPAEGQPVKVLYADDEAVIIL